MLESSYKECIDAVQTAFDTLAHETENFISQAKIPCLAGCGACCEKPAGVWATVGEMLPLANDIFLKGEADHWIEKLRKSSASEVCMMFESHGNGRGSCKSYNFRPSVCRLFSSSVRRKKDAAFELILCGKKREYYSAEAIAEIHRELDRGAIEAPVSQSWGMRIQSLTADLSLNEELPINDALLEALERLSWHYDYVLGPV